VVGHHALQDCEVDLVRLALIRRDETMGRFRIIDVVLGVAQDAPGAQVDAEEVYVACGAPYRPAQWRPGDARAGQRQREGAARQRPLGPAHAIAAQQQQEQPRLRQRRERDSGP
jgi:hypothetical protein